MTLSTIITKFENRLLLTFSSPFWIYKILFISISLAILGAFPRYDYIYSFQNLHQKAHGAWDILCSRSNNLMDTSILKGGDSHISKLTFRLILPILLGVFNGNVWCVVLSQSLLGIVMLYLIAKIVYEITADKLTTFYFTLATSHIYFGVSAFWEMGGFGDSFAYGMLIVAMYYRNPMVIFVALSIASWTDERGFIAGGYVLFWWLFRNTIQKNVAMKYAYKSIFSMQTFAIVAAWISYIVLRLWLINHNHLAIDTSQVGGFMISPEQSSSIGLGLWTSFEGFWILILATGVIMLGNWGEMKVMFCGYTILLVFLCFTSCMVSDINRSISYGYPLVLCSVLILNMFLTRKELHYLVAFITLICVIHPLLMTFGANRVVWAYPLPFQIILFLFR